MKHLPIIFVLLSSILQAQDSLPKAKLKIFDVAPFISFAGYTPNDESISSTSKFSKRNLYEESTGYEKRDYGPKNTSSGGSFGLNLNFRFINSKKRVFKRLQPRICLSGSETIFFDYHLEFTHSYVIDTLRYTNPNKAPLLIDSVSSGYLKYSFIARTVLLEAGANLELLSSKYSILYSSFLVGEAFIVSSEFKSLKREQYTIDAYPNQTQQTKVVLLEDPQTEKVTGGNMTKLSLAMGLEHRFSNRSRRSLGFFAEIRFGWEFYKLKQGYSPLQKGFMFTTGLRYSLFRHK